MFPQFTAQSMLRVSRSSPSCLTLVLLHDIILTFLHVSCCSGNVELLIYSVTIIFVTKLNELFYGTLVAVNSSWVEGMLYKDEQGSVSNTSRHDNEEEDVPGDKQSLIEMQSLMNEVQSLKESVEMLQEQMTCSGSGDARGGRNVDAGRRGTA